MPALRTLLHNLIDYAGLFPPAGLDLPTASANYAAYRAGDEAWALGRFVVPATRLRELETSAEARLHAGGEPWRITALAGPDLPRDLAEIAGFNERLRGHAVADTIELRSATTAAISATLATINGRLEAFVEIPIADDPAPLIATLAAGHGRAKVRTGGITSDAFPQPPHLLRFLRRCVEANVAFKATAGLHHPLRGDYRLTYQPDSGCARMFGFLNVFLAAAFLRHGMSDADALELLEESSPPTLRVTDESIAWSSHRLDEAGLRYARGLARAFGSCSFREPIDDLRALRLL
jgi:hypothetical protein